MKVLNDHVSVLTNFEVKQLLQEQEKEDFQSKNHKKLSKKVLNYLNETPAGKQTSEVIAKAVKELKPFKLTGAETLQVVNLRPSTTTEVQLIVEESEERFKTEEQLDNLVATITSNLPAKK